MHRTATSLAVSLLAAFPLLVSAGGGAKILYVNSYNDGYAWSDGIAEGLKKSIGDEAELKTVFLDSRGKSSEEELAAAAKAANALALEWKPDAIVVSDDIAVNSFLVPYFKGKETPCVFCGVNWDASPYGLPAGNVAGMVEASLVKPMMDRLKSFSGGGRIAFLGSDNETDRVEAHWTSKKLGIEFQCVFVKSMDEWKAAYVKLQESADILLLYSSSGIEGWDLAEAKDFALANAKIPSGSNLDFLSELTLLAFAKSAQEQGEWSGATALRLLHGAKPSEIPLAENSRTVIYLNIPMAEKLGIKFPIDLIRNSKIVK